MDPSEVVGYFKANNVYLKGDSVFAITVISFLCKQPSQTHPILHDIHYWILNCDYFCTDHVYGEANQAAHLVAKNMLFMANVLGQIMMFSQMIYSQSCKLIEKGPGTKGNDHSLRLCSLLLENIWTNNYIYVNGSSIFI